MSPENAIAAPPGAEPTPVADLPVSIEVRDLVKSFRIPTHRVDSLKERLVRPFAAQDYRELRALDGVSFDIHQGEFFGIVGRNGSGKSTLLKLLASIYRADAGTIRMAGRLAPFIELGVGFNMELTGRENVVLNGVMMGLTPAETRRRLEGVIEFAELEEFADLKLKNYSSGMLVRLAFSLMLQVDADVLLIDEVLAVGDAAFQQKCADAFHEMKAKGKTIVLVTHEMSIVDAYCHRAMLIHDGTIQAIGDPAEIGREYLRLNFEQGADTTDSSTPWESEEIRLIDIRAESSDGEAQTTFELSQEIVLETELEVRQELKSVSVGFVLANADGLGIFQFAVPVEGEGAERLVAAGRRIAVRVRLDNTLAAGRYFVHCGVSRQGGTASAALYVHNAVDFLVYGNSSTRGLISIDHDATATVVEGE
jgi:ABC-type polysaccharide/polyol phosphate transport system ATPase subunit